MQHLAVAHPHRPHPSLAKIPPQVWPLNHRPLENRGTGIEPNTAQRHFPCMLYVISFEQHYTPRYALCVARSKRHNTAPLATAVRKSYFPQ